MAQNHAGQPSAWPGGTGQMTRDAAPDGVKGPLWPHRAQQRGRLEGDLLDCRLRPLAEETRPLPAALPGALEIGPCLDVPNETGGKVSYIDRNRKREYDRQRYARRRDEWFAGRWCEVCGKPAEVLESWFDGSHVPKGIWSGSAARRDGIVAGCRVLCAACGIRRRAEKLSKPRAPRPTRETKPMPMNRQPVQRAAAERREVLKAARDIVEPASAPVQPRNRWSLASDDYPCCGLSRQRTPPVPAADRLSKDEIKRLGMAPETPVCRCCGVAA